MRRRPAACTASISSAPSHPRAIAPAATLPRPVDVPGHGDERSEHAPRRSVTAGDLAFLRATSPCGSATSVRSVWPTRAAKDWSSAWACVLTFLVGPRAVGPGLGQEARRPDASRCRHRSRDRAHARLPGTRWNFHSQRQLAPATRAGRPRGLGRAGRGSAATSSGTRSLRAHLPSLAAPRRSPTPPTSTGAIRCTRFPARQPYAG